MLHLSNLCRRGGMGRTLVRCQFPALSQPKGQSSVASCQSRSCSSSPAPLAPWHSAMLGGSRMERRRGFSARGYSRSENPRWRCALPAAWGALISMAVLTQPLLLLRPTWCVYTRFAASVIRSSAIRGGMGKAAARGVRDSVQPRSHEAKQEIPNDESGAEQAPPRRGTVR